MTEVWWCEVQMAHLADKLDIAFCQDTDIDYDCGARRLVPVDALVLVRDADGLWPAKVVEAVLGALRGQWAGPLQELYLPQGVGIVLAAGASAVLDKLAEAAKENPQW